MLQVKASTASQNELLVALGCAAPNCSSRSALKGAWEKYLEPICGVANPHAAAGELLLQLEGVMGIDDSCANGYLGHVSCYPASYPQP